VAAQTGQPDTIMLLKHLHGAQREALYSPRSGRRSMSLVRKYSGLKIPMYTDSNRRQATTTSQRAKALTELAMSHVPAAVSCKWQAGPGLAANAALMAPLDQLHMQEASPTTSIRVQVLVICHDA
jgi:hypothetical protein